MSFFGTLLKKMLFILKFGNFVEKGTIFLQFLESHRMAPTFLVENFVLLKFDEQKMCIEQRNWGLSL
jgi:hypothetical protein